MLSVKGIKGANKAQLNIDRIAKEYNAVTKFKENSIKDAKNDK